MYVKSLYLRDGQRAWLHIYSGHNKPRESFLEVDFQQELIGKAMSLIKNSIQAATTAAAWYLVGSHIPTFDCKHYAAVLKQRTRS